MSTQRNEDDEMTGEARQDEAPRPMTQGQRYLLFALVAIVLALAVAVVFYWISGSDDTSSSSTTVPSGGVILPQNPSLLLLQVDDTWYVENDGNVTMSSVEVRGDSDDVICELGTISPDERAPCEAAGAIDDLTAFGLGPQGQEVEVGPT